MWSKWFGKKKTEEGAPVGVYGSKGAGNDLPAAVAGPLVQLNVVVLSDLGMIRTNNEDMGLFVRNASEDVIRRKGYLLVVADGMGGHLAGEVASKLAADTISEEYFHAGHNDIGKSLDKAFRSANEKIFSKSA